MNIFGNILSNLFNGIGEVEIIIDQDNFDTSDLTGCPIDENLSYRDAEGKEYIWSKTQRHRNPLYKHLHVLAEDTEFEEIEINV